MDLKSRQNEIIERGYAQEIYEFALQEYGVDPILLSQALVKSKRKPDYYGDIPNNYEDDEYYDYPLWEDEELAYYYYNFANDVKGADIDLLCKAVAESRNAKYIYLFARNIEGANIELLEDALIDVFCNFEESDNSILYDFAIYVKGANAKKFEKALPYVDLETLYDFAVDVDGINIKLVYRLFLKEVRELLFDCMEDDDYRAVYHFVRDIKEADVDVLINKLIKYYNNMEFLYYVAQDVEGVNLDLVEDKMIELMYKGDSKYYMESYVNCVEGANLVKIAQALEVQIDIFTKRGKNESQLFQYTSLLDNIKSKLNNNMTLSLNNNSKLSLNIE